MQIPLWDTRRAILQLRTNQLKKLAEVTSCEILTEKVDLYMSLPYDPPTIQQFVDDLDALS